MCRWLAKSTKIGGLYRSKWIRLCNYVYLVSYSLTTSWKRSYMGSVEWILCDFPTRKFSLPVRLLAHLSVSIGTNFTGAHFLKGGIKQSICGFWVNSFVRARRFSYLIKECILSICSRRFNLFMLDQGHCFRKHIIIAFKTIQGNTTNHF